MVAPIVVDVGVAEPQRELATALLDACSQAAAGDGAECRLVRDAPNGPYTAIAIVTWEEGDRARVEVGLRRVPASEWRTRELTFQTADADVERYRSVGFVIGTLATAARDDSATPSRAAAANGEPTASGSAPNGVAAPNVSSPKASASKKSAAAPALERPKSEPAPEAPAPEPREAEGPTSPRVPRQYGWIGVAGALGGGLDHGGPRYGGRAWLGVRVLPHLALLATGGTSLRARDAKGLAASWYEGGVGLGVSSGAPSVPHLDAHGEFVQERFVADARARGAHQVGKRVNFAGRFGVDGVLPLGGVFDVVLGVDGFFRPATRIDVGDVPDGSTRNFELGASAGVRVEL
jgi:hypothetical protein